MENPTEHQHSSTLGNRWKQCWNQQAVAIPMMAIHSLSFPTGPSATGSDEGTLNGSNPTWTAPQVPPLDRAPKSGYSL
jgi:hypothetical protein